MESIGSVLAACLGKCCAKEQDEDGEVHIKAVLLCCACVEKGIQIEVVDGAQEEEAEEKSQKV